MGVCNTKEEVVLTDKEQVEFLNQLRLSFNELEFYVENLKDQEVNYKMIRLIFILNFMKEVSPFLDQLEKGRKCEANVKELLMSAIASVKQNDRANYNKQLVDLKNYFKE